MSFPVPHTDAANTTIDLNAQLLINPHSSFLFHMKGDSMEGIGIYEGDTLILDRSIRPRHNHVVLAVLDGENMVRRLYKQGQTIGLMPENEKFRPIKLAEGMELQIFGVVTARIRNFSY